VWLDRHWAWAPGPIVRRPVYAPALVAFVGGAGWSLAATRGPAVGWFPLGWREPFVPWYRASTRHVHAVNATHVTNIATTANVRHVHRGRTDAITVVSRQAFVSSRSAWRERHRVGHDDLVRAEVIRNRPPAERARASFGADRPSARPPVTFRSQEAAVTRPPAAFTREGGDTREHRVFGSQPGEREARERRDHRQIETAAPRSDLARQREPERRGRQEAAERARGQQESPERGRNAQRHVPSPPTARPSVQQAQPVPRAQSAQPFRSSPPPQAQAQQPQASRGSPPRSRQDGSEERSPGERRAQRQAHGRN
jgi:hypothetical protein